MGGFLGIGGSSSKTDRSTELTGFNQLKNLFNTGFNAFQSGSAKGGADTGAGVGALGKSLAFWQKLLSGDRAAMTQAVAPETNAVQSQADATRRQESSLGTARGGGTAGANRTAHDDAMAKIDNLLFGVRPAAASATADIGGKLADVGTRETALANQQLGLATESASNLTKLAGESRVDSYKINQDMVGKWSQAILNIMGAIA